MLRPLSEILKELQLINQDLKIITIGWMKNMEDQFYQQVMQELHELETKQQEMTNE